MEIHGNQVIIMDDIVEGKEESLDLQIEETLRKLMHLYVCLNYKLIIEQSQLIF